MAGIGNIKFVCLALMTEGLSTGYDICRAIRRTELRRYVSSGQATVYANLRDLERNGHAIHTRRTTSGRPDRIEFEITASGSALVSVDSISRDDAAAIPILIRFFSLLSPADIRMVVAHQLEVAEEARTQREVDHGEGKHPLQNWINETWHSHSMLRERAMHKLLNELSRAENPGREQWPAGNALP
ncbi:PadR family transcriptional regulator [Devosia sp. LjRoot3]|uniref:PadR family transcriptional regulator n=1 Tax=Devosia sp. LjRoot3 TaxID=3342319 RepID=UPI003ECF94D5